MRVSLHDDLENDIGNDGRYIITILLNETRLVTIDFSVRIRYIRGVGCNYRKRMKSNDIDLMALSELELRELFKKVDWSEVDPTIDEIESELENEVDRFMSLTAEEYRNEIGIKSEKVKNGKIRKSKKG